MNGSHHQTKKKKKIEKFNIHEKIDKLYRIVIILTTTIILITTTR